MKLLYVGGSSCSAETLGRLFLLANEICFLDRPSVTFNNWGTIGHQSPLRQFETEGLPVKLSVSNPPQGPARELYAPYVEADLTSPEFVKAVLDGLRTDNNFAAKCLQPAAKYGEGLTGADVRRILLSDTNLYSADYALSKADQSVMYKPETFEGSVATLRMIAVNASIEVTSALLMAEELGALPVSDDFTFAKLLSLRSTSATYVGDKHSLAPMLGLHFARSIIPDEMLKKISFGGIFDYRRNSEDVYRAWTTLINSVAAKISDGDFSNPENAINKIIASELAPKITEYENELASVRDRLFADLISRPLRSRIELGWTGERSP
ncbi:hypothetical protein ABIF74_011823 [Bradyrhizobium japonicum]